ncbi:MAG TPA: hypothetical protein VNH11_11090 [Pirellulales bacterium]|nr:hypothetical protein [Pirellulales bacterium]
MNEANMERVREDLAVMKQAMGLHLPFQRDHVWACLALAVVGIVMAAVTAFTRIAAVPVTQGSLAHLSYIAFVVVPVLLVIIGLGVVSYRRKALAPLLWRESRTTAVVATVAVPVYLSFLAWAVSRGISPAALTAATLFLAGLFCLLRALSEPGRLYVLGWAVSTMLAGACAPLGNYGNAGILAGAWLLVGGLFTAGIMAWQLRRRGAQDDR